MGNAAAAHAIIVRGELPSPVLRESYLSDVGSGSELKGNWNQDILMVNVLTRI